ncbi:NAD(P)-binding protein [Planctomycetota bacterium]
MRVSGKNLAYQVQKRANIKPECALVLGGGISGATVSKRLSEAGWEVHLAEKEATIGGRVVEMGCKATDVCLRCNVCMANELLRAVAASPDIHVHTRTELIKLESGAEGCRYTAILKQEPTFVDRNKCVGCQVCVGVCPEKCIVKPKITIPPGVPVIDYSLCRRNLGKECSVCEQTCPTKAIDMGQKISESKMEVDSVVIATGYEPYDPAVNASYGYGEAENIITGIEAERQLAEGTKIARPSDGLPANRVAFVQCVGSRSEEIHRRPEDTDYCSAVCCAYALRTAQLLKYQSEDVDVTVFYMDIQSFGKGFNEFYEKCQDNMTFIRSRPYEIRQGQDGAVRVIFTPQFLAGQTEAQVCEQEFDLVILSVGIRPRPDVTKLAEALLVPVNEQGFFGLKGASALPSLQREGIFVAGACESPKDIQSCMAQAEAVSAAIISNEKQKVKKHKTKTQKLKS